MTDEAHDWQVRVPTTVVEDQRLGHATFRVYCCLKSFANREGACWPSIRTIGKRLGMARSTVLEHLAALVSYGWIRSEAVSRCDRGRAANHYRFLSPSDQPTGLFGAFDGPCRSSTGTPVGPADTEDHQNITIEPSPPAAREGGRWNDLSEYQPTKTLCAGSRRRTAWTRLTWSSLRIGRTSTGPRARSRRIWPPPIAAGFVRRIVSR